ncbi:MAG: ATP-dependent endonuclease [Actinobacteria bacterium]|nr:ATP-dependent endonuclease [Actinomycetota bacterium]
MTRAPRAVVLVEGVSDQLAVEAIARRRGHDLDAEGVRVVPMGGSKNVGAFLERFSGVRVAGLGDAKEEADFRRAVQRAGLAADPDRSAMERLGFYLCEEDLEDELIRAVGAEAVLEIVEAQGELGRFRTFQQMPQKRGQRLDVQLRRFLGAGSGRKLRYAPALVDALDLGRVPRPLDRVLQHITRR